MYLGSVWILSCAPLDLRFDMADNGLEVNWRASGLEVSYECLLFNAN